EGPTNVPCVSVLWFSQQTLAIRRRRAIVRPLQPVRVVCGSSCQFSHPKGGSSMEPRKEDQENRFQIEQLEGRIAPTATGSLGYEGQPGNQGNGLRGYEGHPGNQGGHYPKT